MTKKFGFLRFIAGFYKVIGIILLIAAVLGAVGALLTGILGGAALQNFGNNFGVQNTDILGGIFGGILGGLVILIGLGFSAICQFAIGEAIMVFLSIEENTRAAAALQVRQE